MQKKNQNKTSIIKQIILYTILVILVLLILFAEDIIKLTNKNKMKLAENTENELISNEPNIPQLSAGMIPVKWDGTNWVITTSKDKDWYDYANGKPAYIMLNDGTYQSELIRDMTGKKLASDVVGNDAPVVPNENDTLGTIFMWIPRFVYKENGEIAYIKEEVTPGVDWIVPEMFSYVISDETKPNFSLNGIWIEKDVDTTYATKIAEMNKEEGTYGFMANTKARQITATDISTFQTYTANTVGAPLVGIPEGDDTAVPLILNDIANINRIILQIVNTNKYEPIKAKILYNTVDQKIEIQVTYTSNGIREIIDEYENSMTLTEKNGIIQAELQNVFVRGTYKFTIIDNKGNKKELRVIPNIDAVYKVVYINGIDNMDNTATYTKTQETKTTTENTLLNQLTAMDTTKTFNRAIQNSNGITAITQEERIEENMYMYKKYKVKYSFTQNRKLYGSNINKSGNKYGYATYQIEDDGSVTMNQWGNWSSGGYRADANVTSASNRNGKIEYGKYFYEFTSDYEQNGSMRYSIYQILIVRNAAKGSYVNTEIFSKDFVTENCDINGFWYEKGEIAPKYTLHKYSSALNLLSTYDVDTATLTTVPIDISNKGKNKLKLTLTASDSDYRTYISSDNTNWQEVTDITSGEPKELNVEGWNNLYIKIEINTSTINSIDVAYYKD